MQKAHEMYAVKLDDRQPADVVANNPEPFATQEDIAPAPKENEQHNVNDMVEPPPDQTPPIDPGDMMPADEVPTTDPNVNPDEPVTIAPKPKPAPPRPKPKPPEYVDVEICADSHELATMYCPETVVRTYVRGQQPSRRCHIHNPR
jgi:hypothetical protein